MRTSNTPRTEPRHVDTILAAVNLAFRAGGLGLGSWIGYQLIKQNGRILLQLDAIQERLNAVNGEPAAAPQPAGLPIGSEAPAFALPDMTGATVSLESFRGSRLQLIFFDPNCGFCRNMAADVADLPADGRDGRPLPVVITTGDAAANRGWVAEHRVRCPVLLQPGREVHVAYGVTGTPSGCLVDEGGKIASAMRLGAPDTLALAEEAASVPPSNGATAGSNGTARGNRPLSESRLLRSGLPAGTPAPAFRLARLDGREATLGEFRGRRLLLVFSDPECGPCNDVAPQLEALHRADPNLQLLMISRGDVPANERKVQEHGLTFPVALQRQWEMSRAYGMFATPIAYLIDEHGTIAADVAVGVDQILSLAKLAGSPAEVGSRV